MNTDDRVAKVGLDGHRTFSPSYAVRKQERPWRGRQSRSGIKVFTTFARPLRGTVVVGEASAPNG